MTLDQALSLEPVFAKMQPDGTWVVPDWLNFLIFTIIERDKEQSK